MASATAGLCPVAWHFPRHRLLFLLTGDLLTSAFGLGVGRQGLLDVVIPYSAASLLGECLGVAITSNETGALPP